MAVFVSASLDCVDGERGSGDACHAVGEFFAVVKSDYATARGYYETNCDERKHMASCFNLGRLLLAGKGGDVDDGGAARRFRQACDAGSGPGCHHLGLMAYERGDKRKGRRHLARACDLRDAESCYVIGSNLLKKETTSTDDEGRFGRLLRGERGKPRRDLDKARACLDLACDEGHAPACHNLAVLFKHGDDGVPPDAEKFQHYAKRTNDLVQARGAAQGVKVA
eukprot:CAMPEP_0118890028 /NCGR_PEP_ID=MMETSP1166-20130328/687_1 /TAXON_ID=1104430 /ORGANISM="Chrysoreinhardia sp, Strain CCMP3193" /LENGTH=223 /DNA_ID=CAMNT_0006828627 /DNA_START=43 /DNA_END=714 /DNA_ORIENTATION=-